MSIPLRGGVIDVILNEHNRLASILARQLIDRRTGGTTNASAIAHERFEDNKALRRVRALGFGKRISTLRDSGMGDCQRQTKGQHNENDRTFTHDSSL